MAQDNEYRRLSAPTDSSTESENTVSNQWLVYLHVKRETQNSKNKKIQVEVDLHNSNLCCTKVNYKQASDKDASLSREG